MATILAFRWLEVIVDLDEAHDARPAERAPSSESHDPITDALKPLTQHIQADLDALRAKINTRRSASQRTPLPTEQPKQATPDETTHRIEHSQTSSQPATPGRDNSPVAVQRIAGATTLGSATTILVPYADDLVRTDDWIRLTTLMDSLAQGLAVQSSR